MAGRESRLSSLLPTRRDCTRQALICQVHLFHCTPSLCLVRLGRQRNRSSAWYARKQAKHALLKLWMHACRRQHHDMNAHEHAWHSCMALAGMCWHPQRMAWHHSMQSHVVLHQDSVATFIGAQASRQHVHNTAIQFALHCILLACVAPFCVLPHTALRSKTCPCEGKVLSSRNEM